MPRPTPATESPPQDRWDDQYGRVGLEVLEESPEHFLLEGHLLGAPQAALLERGAPWSGQRCLEIGCGDGLFGARLGRRGAHLVGLDLGPRLARLARGVSRVNRTGGHFLVARGDALPFPAESFDRVVGNGILHHMSRSDLDTTLREVARVLRPGGRALFVEPVENSPLFHWLQELVPVGRPGHPQHRPSRLQFRAWQAYVGRRDDRPLTLAELARPRGDLRLVDHRYFGWSIRLARLLPAPYWVRWMEWADGFLTASRSPLRHLSREVLVEYRREASELGGTLGTSANPA